MISWSLPTQEEGIIVAADANSEWLLSWWWTRYHTYNTLPVVFIDFGMSCLGKTFCEEHGTLVCLSQNLSFSPSQNTQWETIYGKQLWEKRQSWLKKPFALLQTPFLRTLWLDLDCEVLTSLASLFGLPGDILLAEETQASHVRERENNTIYEDETLYNSGVILYNHGSKVIEKWAQKILQHSGEFWGDQHALSRVIYEEKINIEPLHENYNWRMSQGFNIHAAVIHWVGSWGKEYIRKHGGLFEEMAKLPKI